jgi:hypothetical protein
MALTASTGFRLYKGQDMDNQVLLNFRIANSSTVRIGDIVRINTGGFAVRALTGEIFAGVVQGIVDESGVPPFTAFYIDKSGSTITGDDTIATSSSNQTRANYQNVQIIFDPAGQFLYYNDADNDLASTNLLQTFNIASSNQVTFSGASDTTSKQVQLVSIDPDNDGDLSKGLFRITMSQFGLGPDEATTKNAA